MKYTEQANGVARSLGSVTIVFPFGTEPYLALHGERVTIQYPERFGAWETPEQQRAYLRRFAEGLDTPYDDQNPRFRSEVPA